MPKSPTSIPNNPRMAAVHTFGHPGAPLPRTSWGQQRRAQTNAPGMSPQSSPLPYPPTTVALVRGTGTDLMVSWSAPATDGAHAAATGYNLRFSLAGLGTWTTVVRVASPYTITSLVAATAFDVQVQSINAAGSSIWSPTSTLATATAGPFAPNVPAIASVVPPPDGTAGKLAIVWTAPATDASHGAATGYNLRYAPAGAGSWTTVTGVTSPYSLTGLTGGAAIDVQVQGTNAAASPGPWSAATTATSWGATVAPGLWIPANTQTHGASIAPNGGAQLVAVAAPTAVTGGVFAWSSSNSVVPTSGLIAGGGDGQANGWGQWFNAPATAGTYYLWLLAQGAGAVTTGALVTGPIAVT